MAYVQNSIERILDYHPLVYRIKSNREIKVTYKFIDLTAKSSLTMNSENQKFVFYKNGS